MLITVQILLGNRLALSVIASQCHLSQRERLWPPLRPTQAPPSSSLSPPVSSLRGLDGGVCFQCEVIAVAVTLLARHCKGYGFQFCSGLQNSKLYHIASLHTLRLRQRTLARLHFSIPKPNTACLQIVSQFIFNDVVCLIGQPISSTSSTSQPVRLELLCDDLELFVQRLVLLIVAPLFH